MEQASTPQAITPKSASPQWRTITVRLASPSDPNLAFSIDSGNGGRPDKRSQLTLNRKTGAEVRWEPFSSYNSGRQLRAWIRFTHTGEAGGLTRPIDRGNRRSRGRDARLHWTEPGDSPPDREPRASQKRHGTRRELPGRSPTTVRQPAAISRRLHPARKLTSLLIRSAFPRTPPVLTNSQIRYIPI